MRIVGFAAIGALSLCGAWVFWGRISFEMAAVAFGAAASLRALFATAIRTSNGWRVFSGIRGRMRDHIRRFERGEHRNPVQRGLAGQGSVSRNDRGIFVYRDGTEETEFSWNLDGKNCSGGGTLPFADYTKSKEDYPLAYLLDRVWRGSVGDERGIGISRGTDCYILPLKAWSIRPYQAPLREGLEQMVSGSVRE